MFRREGAGEFAGIDAARAGVEADHTAHILDAADRAFKAAAGQEPRVLPDEAADVHLRAAGRDRAAGPEIVDLRPCADTPEEAEARALARHAHARDQMAVAVEDPGEIRYGREVRIGEVEIRRELEHAPGRIALLLAGGGEAPEV